jgi:hypothetical protein
MQNRKLKDWLDSYLKYTSNTEPRRSFRLWTGVSVVAGALQRKCYMSHGLTPLYPNLYIVLVAPPGKARKSTAMNSGRDLLKEVKVKLAPTTNTREGLIKVISEANSLSSLQHEELYKRAFINHSSLTVFSGEFGVFMGEDAKMIQDLQDMFDCPTEFEYNTKTDDLKVYIENLWLNIMGATTPKYIRGLFNRSDLVGGGLASRIIFVYEEDKEKSIPLPIMTKSEKALRKDLIHDLNIIKSLSGEFKFTEEFINLYATWYTNMDNDSGGFKQDSFREYESRRQVHLMKLCIIFSASRSNEMVLRDIDFNRALEELTLVEEKMFKVFLGVGELKDAQVIANIVNYVESVGEIRYDELYKVFVYDIDAKRFMEAISNLIRAGKLTKVQDPNNSTKIIIRSIYYEK